MCGISGWVSYVADLRTQEQAVAAMGARIACRGPDDEGMWVSEHAILGHRRLVVIDRRGGRQPMVLETPSGPVVISYNGEVYNHPELRRELQAHGHVFRTRSDTEVILAGYLRWGERVAERLRGIFAFAIWDGRSRRLLLVRDRLGVKPLCFYPTRDGVLFGSEPKAILAHPLATAAVGIGGWRELVARLKPPGHLIWEGMQEVKPGTKVIVDADGVQERTFWRLESRPHTDDPAATVAHVRELLEGIVSEELVADVPVGVLLSGGLDSSLITALAARECASRRERIDSYVVDFTGHAEFFAETGHELLQRDLDAPFAREVAEMSGTCHTRVELDSIRLAHPELRERVVRARDLPLGLGDHDVSHLLLFERIRERCTVALSGEIADELFGGYLIFSDPRVLHGEGWPWHLLNPGELDTSLAMLTGELRAALDLDAFMADSYASATGAVEHMDGESRLERRLREITYLEVTRHTGYLLDYTDRLAMAVGLEVRVPYGDHRLIEYVYNVPWAIRAPNGTVKGLLKNAAGGLLPESVLERVKSAYPNTPHPGYLRAIQRQGLELAAQPAHPVFELISRDWLAQAAGKPVETLSRADRSGINQALELAVWIDLYHPAITI